MKDTRRQFVRCAFYDQLAMQKQFEKMASQGWLIDKISSFFWTYKRIEPTNLHITVTYFPTASEFDPAPSEKQQMMEICCQRWLEASDPLGTDSGLL